MIELEPKIKGSRLITSLATSSPSRDNNIQFVGSGKAALGLIMQHLKSKEILTSKMNTIYVPPWMGTWVYASFLPYAYPVLEPTDDTKIVWCYHQYGFPQNMDRIQDIADSRNLSVIEDCAHACDSKYKDKIIGTFGDYSLYSFSKFAFCLALGGVFSKDDNFSSFVEQKIVSSSNLLRFIINTTRFLDNTSGNTLSNLRYIWREMNYAVYYHQPIPSQWGIKLWLQTKEYEKKARRKNYLLLKNQTMRWGLCNHLEETNIAPYAVPLLIPSNKRDAVVQELLTNNIWAGVRNFDIARCLFEPNYQEIVLVPIHSGMNATHMEKMLDSLKIILG
jgi:hypothetical protein